MGAGNIVDTVAGRDKQVTPVELIDHLARRTATDGLLPETFRFLAQGKVNRLAIHRLPGELCRAVGNRHQTISQLLRLHGGAADVEPAAVARQVSRSGLAQQEGQAGRAEERGAVDAIAFPVLPMEMMSSRESRGPGDPHAVGGDEGDLPGVRAIADLLGAGPAEEKAMRRPSGETRLLVVVAAGQDWRRAIGLSSESRQTLLSAISARGRRASSRVTGR